VKLPKDTQIGVVNVVNRLLPSELFWLRMAVKLCSYTANSEIGFFLAQPLKLWYVGDLRSLSWQR